jgi:hypothetical protein
MLLAIHGHHVKPACEERPACARKLGPKAAARLDGVRLVLLQLLRATQELVRAPDRRNAPLFGDRMLA